VILLNGASRRIFALGAETDYRARPFVELCRDRACRNLSAARCIADNSVIEREIMIQNPRRSISAPARANPHLARRGMGFVFHDVTS